MACGGNILKYEVCGEGGGPAAAPWRRWQTASVWPRGAHGLDIPVDMWNSSLRLNYRAAVIVKDGRLIYAEAVRYNYRLSEGDEVLDDKRQLLCCDCDGGEASSNSRRAQGSSSSSSGGSDYKVQGG